MKLSEISKQSRFYKSIIAIGEITLIWMVIIAKLFVFNKYIGNELDILPFARQFIDSSWLPSDWYLNLEIGYRLLFNLIFGYVIDWLGFLNGAYIGRLIAYLLLAVALFVFLRTTRLRFSLGLIVVLIFLENQSLIAGEWIAGGADTKTFAYAFSLLSFSYFFQRKYLVGFAFAGVALSFHVLIGIYALICTAIALLLTLKSWRQELRMLIRGSWPIFVTGVFGLLAIVQQLLPQGEVDANRAWEIYVEFRVPHHVLPSAWKGDLWIVELILAACLFLCIYLITKKGAIKFTAAYALGSVGLFGIGFAFFAFGNTTLLRFYWFRYPAVMIPFLGLMLVALVLDQLTYIDFSSHPRIPKNLHWIQPILTKGLPILFALVAILLTLQAIQFLRVKYQRGLHRPPQETRAVFDWIRENTSEETIFLIDPLIIDFYTFAERARFVSFNHSPQSAGDILEWYERVQLNNNQQTPQIPLSRGELQANFYQLDPHSIRWLGDTYGLSYYLGLADQQLPFEPVYQDDNFTLYAIE